jgi:hypothetical protein
VNAIPLQPLRIPTGWSIRWNDFCALDPATIPDADSPLWLYLHEDMLQIENTQTSTIIDLGWYPDGDAAGAFRALVIQRYGDAERDRRAWDTPLATHTSRSLHEAVAQLETWLLQYTSAPS